MRIIIDLERLKRNKQERRYLTAVRGVLGGRGRHNIAVSVEEDGLQPPLQLVQTSHGSREGKGEREGEGDASVSVADRRRENRTRL